MAKKLKGSRKYLSSLVVSAIRKTYDPNGSTREWAVLEQVREAAGHDAQRAADVVMFNLWPSRGMEIWGIEIKTNRTDWLRELRDPAKVDEGTYRFCDRWYIAIESPDVANLSEIPPTWGLMQRDGEKIKILKEAPKLDPIPPSKGFLVCCMRQFCKEEVSEDEIAKARAEGAAASWVDVQEHQARDKAAYAKEVKRLEEEARKAWEYLRDFEVALGVSLSGSSHIGLEHIYKHERERVMESAQVLGTLLSLHPLKVLEKLESISATFRPLYQGLQAAVEGQKKLLNEPPP